jgi:hypothetical protein
MTEKGFSFLSGAGSGKGKNASFPDNHAVLDDPVIQKISGVTNGKIDAQVALHFRGFFPLCPRHHPVPYD